MRAMLWGWVGAIAVAGCASSSGTSSPPEATSSAEAGAHDAATGAVPLDAGDAATSAPDAASADVDAGFVDPEFDKPCNSGAVSSQCGHNTFCAAGVTDRFSDAGVEMYNHCTWSCGDPSQCGESHPGGSAGPGAQCVAMHGGGGGNVCAPPAP